MDKPLSYIKFWLGSPQKCRALALLRETLMKAFPAPDLRREAADSSANLCASAGGSKEVLIESALP